MSELAQATIRKLLKLSYQHGFCYFPIKLIAEQMAIDDPNYIYDPNTETGVIAEYVADGMVHCMGSSLAIEISSKNLLENWSNFRP